MKTYLHIADELENRIKAGDLQPGDRLPPQRTFAYERGIAASTITRAYGELARRGFAGGEVGRGTYILDAGSGQALALSASRDDLPVDLEVNFPTLDGQEHRMMEGLQTLLEAEAGECLFRPRGRFDEGDRRLKRAFADFLATGPWRPDPSSLQFAAGGRQAIAAALSALVPAGGTLAVEKLTYPIVKALASRLGIRLLPVEMDQEGLIPAALEAAQRRQNVKAVYFQSAIHNPIGTVMGRERRQALGRVLEKTGMAGIEDCVYRFLIPRTFSPVAQYAPDHVIVLDSFSKRLSPGLNLGLLAVPEGYRQDVQDALLQGGWSATSFALQACRAWLDSGLVVDLETAKRRDARKRQKVLQDCLSSFDIISHPSAYHAWLRLPKEHRAESFVAKAAREGIALVPGAAFAADPAYAPPSVRIALASSTLGRLRNALMRLSDILER